MQEQPHDSQFPITVDFRTLSDEAMMQLYTQDETHLEDVLNEICRRYYEEIYMYIGRLGVSERDRRDLLHDFFIEKLPSVFGKYGFLPGKSFRAWFFTVARNYVIDYWRRYRNRFESLPSFDVTCLAKQGQALDEATRPEIELREEMDQQVFAINLVPYLLDGLPPIYKKILHARYYEDKTLVEIADELNKPYGTVQVYHFRAILALRDVCEYYQKEGYM